ncbi:endonuclease I [Pseudoalteromonas sp. MSK9-3]|uniref:endonuclease n=1 Tax=Pseudoalteromonas sp. MSK9-3 TaxID=1897633 RepID=UPI000E6CE847|nr:endonuclease [Pseudoalteromonas sp. MSK9-3]RJE76095.1 endonuclease I [Pseudoalteromonas sp. MSK9-3]
MYFIIVLYATLLALPSHAKEFNSFYQAKRYLTKTITKDQRTLYCGCKIIKTGKKLSPDARSCGYVPRRPVTHAGKINSRTTRIEWEHIVSAWEFGHQLQCWQHGGRKNCRKTSSLFRKMEADIRNLAPAIGEINGDRSNYRFGPLPHTPLQHGQCQVRINFKKRIIHPPKSARKDIAQAYFYMRDTYQLKISAKQTKLFNYWLSL